MPMVLQRASQLSHAVGTMAFETRDGQAMMKPEDLDEVLSQGSYSSHVSMVLEATPWMSESPLAPDVNYGHEFLAKDSTVPKSQRLLLEQVAPSQAKSMTSGMAPVPPQPPGFSSTSKPAVSPQLCSRGQQPVGEPLVPTLQLLMGCPVYK